jgi:hypothetical protein
MIKKLLPLLLLILMSSSNIYGQGRFFNSSMDYSYQGIEWDGVTPFVEHIKDGFKTSKIYKIKSSTYETEHFDIIYMYELKNLTSEKLRLCMKFSFYDRDGILMKISNPEDIILEPYEQKTFSGQTSKMYNGTSVHSSDWEISEMVWIEEPWRTSFIIDGVRSKPGDWKCNSEKYSKKSGWF